MNEYQTPAAFAIPPHSYLIFLLFFCLYIRLFLSLLCELLLSHSTLYIFSQLYLFTLKIVQVLLKEQNQALVQTSTSL